MKKDAESFSPSVVIGVNLFFLIFFGVISLLFFIMSSENRFFKFFSSPKGRQFARGASVVAAVGAFAVNFQPHAFLAYKHKEIVACYKDGLERPVSDNLKKRFEMAQDYIKATDFEKKWLRPFMVSGFDLYHLGSTKLRHGAYVGIPVNYTYTSPTDINKSDIILRGNPVNWNSQGGQLLQESLVLTEDEQIFGLAREIMQLQTRQVFLNSFYPACCIGLMYVMTNTLNNKLRLHYRPRSLRVTLYTIIGLYCFGIYAFITDYTQVHYDNETDERLAELGKGFIAAGIRFYDKILKKNIAVRELTGDDSQYTAFGNENFLVRQKRLPLTDRKAFFEEKLKELEKEENNPV